MITVLFLLSCKLFSDKSYSSWIFFPLLLWKLPSKQDRVKLVKDDLNGLNKTRISVVIYQLLLAFWQSPLRAFSPEVTAIQTRGLIILLLCSVASMANCVCGGTSAAWTGNDAVNRVREFSNRNMHDRGRRNNKICFRYIEFEMPGGHSVGKGS